VNATVCRFSLEHDPEKASPRLDPGVDSSFSEKIMPTNDLERAIAL
jgi:hypothetical protein